MSKTKDSLFSCTVSPTGGIKLTEKDVSWDIDPNHGPAIREEKDKERDVRPDMRERERDVRPAIRESMTIPRYQR